MNDFYQIIRKQTGSDCVVRAFVCLFFLLWQVTEHPMHFETVIIILRKFWMRNVKMKVCT